MAAAASMGRTMRSKPFAAAKAGTPNLIDNFIWQDLQANNITPADKTTDFEFARPSVTLDLTGRIPTADRVVQIFTSSVDPNRREALVEDLLASPAWTDKWTIFLGDIYKNTAANVQVNIRSEGRNAFYKFLHQNSLAANGAIQPDRNADHGRRGPTASIRPMAR